MKFLIAFIITAILIYLTGVILPWWFIAVAGFGVAAVVEQAPFRSFLAGFLAGFFTWTLLAVIIDRSNDQILATRIAALFGLAKPVYLVIITGMVGGVVTALAALCGSFLRKRMGKTR